jgi:signal transduction histidine kinase
VCQELLTGLLGVTQSDYGLLGEIAPGAPPTCTIRALGGLRAAAPERRDAMCKVVERVLLTGKTVTADLPREPLLTHSSVAPLHAPRGLLGLPCTSGDQVVSVLVLGDRPGGFSAETIAFLQPVLSTCAQLITAYHNDRRRKAAELALAQERASLAQRVAERTAELQLANAELTHAMHAKDEFLATINHELRTPLNAILLFSELLHKQMQGPLNARQLRAVAGIEESGHHLLTLINDILDVAKLEAGKLVLTPAPCAAEALCEASLRLVAEMANRKEIQLHLQLDPAVGVLEADERRLKQILVNLLSNAVKFTPAQGEVGLAVSGDAAQGMVHFTVWDTGIGIARADIEKLFQPFVQFDSGHTRQHGGTGLGLALVRHMTHLHGGSVAVESEVGQGSRFTISLPWQPAPADLAGMDSSASAQPLPAPQAGMASPGGTAETPEATSAPTGAATAAPSTGPVILLAEDNEANVAALSDFLGVQPCRLLVAGTGKQAVALARAHRPDLILMDVQMPEMDGLEATRTIRAEPGLEQVPIVVLTALVMPGDRERCLAAGATDFIGKPLQLARLTEVLDAYLGPYYTLRKP